MTDREALSVQRLMEDCPGLDSLVHKICARINAASATHQFAVWRTQDGVRMVGVMLCGEEDGEGGNDV
jgi:hypothetical protein